MTTIETFPDAASWAEACAARLKADGFRAAVLHRETK